MTTVPLCFSCRHRLAVPGRLACTAFPAEVPDAIAFGRHDHRDPYPGDGGIRYEPDDRAGPLPAPAAAVEDA